MAKELKWDRIMLAEFRKLAILTEDEDNILSAWACGKSIPYMGMMYNMSERTVIRILNSIREKYDAVQVYTPLLPARNK